MSDAPYIFDFPKDAEDENVEFKRVNTSFTVRALHFLLAIIALALVLEACYYFIILPLISNAKIVLNVKGEFLQDAEVMAMLGIDGNVKWSSIDSSEIANLLQQYPIVETASVRKKFPDKVFIDIVERRAVAVSFVKTVDDTVPLEIDKEGMVFRIGWSTRTNSLTIVSGLNFQNPKVGMKINEQLKPLFAQLDFMSRKEPVLLSKISEIKIREKRYGDYDLILYPTYRKIKVLANKEFTTKVLSRMMLVLDVIGGADFPDDIEYIDIRGENVVYKCKEMRRE